METRVAIWARVRAASILAVLAVVLLSGGLARAAAIPGPFTVRGSVEQVDVTGAHPGARIVLLRHRRTVQSRHVDDLGAALFRNVAAGRGYRVLERGSAGVKSGPITVLSTRSAPPSTGIYNQPLPASGYGYLTTRDGTKLAIDVRLPAGSGPYPTLIEYSGYGYADPATDEKGIAQIANALGFAVVDINMRGTGCSGGAFDYFEPLQSLDGYDAIETVAHQPWVLHHRVGMMGISYGGISQLFVAATDPPDLAGITPLSVIDNTATTLYPGGILNTGFAQTWAVERVHDAKPASATGGQPWALTQIENGDATCAANQALHAEAVDLLAKTRANRFYRPAIADPVSPVTFVHKIKAPVYLACQWTDEQTGGHCADLAEHFSGTRHKWFTFTNGAHIDSLDPATFNRWYDFLELYVAGQAPHLSPFVRALSPVIYSTAMGIQGVTLPQDPIQNEPSYAAALSAFQALAPVRILFDNGAGGPQPGDPYPAFEQSFARFPVPGTQARSWYLGAAGTLSGRASRRRGTDRFTWNPKARPATDFTGDTGGGPGGIWTTTPRYNWLPNPRGSAVAYVSAPLHADTTVIGGGAVQAWIRSSARNVDLQATLSEVRPDGKETFVQSGWLRTSERTLNTATSTPLDPVLTRREADVAPLPHGRFTEVTIPLYYEGHVYRRGSRIRITITAPGGDQPTWGFAQTKPAGTAKVWVTFSRRRPSHVVLPVVPGVHVSSALPPCPGLRGEPCRAYVTYVNRGS